MSPGAVRSPLSGLLRQRWGCRHDIIIAGVSIQGKGGPGLLIYTKRVIHQSREKGGGEGSLEGQAGSWICERFQALYIHFSSLSTHNSPFRY